MKKLRPWFVLGGVLLAMVVVLRLQGRRWICECGYVLAWTSNTNSADNSQQAFDPYTFTHILHGFAFIAFVHLLAPRISEIWKLVAALSLEAVWEVIENTNFIIERYRSETMALGYIGDTILNSFGDVLACALGAIVARQLGVFKTLVLVVLIEVALLLTVRDNLTLNIVMLFYPIDAIKHWQLGQ